jgi:hypothetical protein
MATINYKDTKQYLSFVIKREFFRGRECKKRGKQGKTMWRADEKVVEGGYFTIRRIAG